MEYRIGVEQLFSALAAWDGVIPGAGKIHLVACGGTALTLLGYKESTKDVDLLVPRSREYDRLTRFLKNAGYVQTTSFGWKRLKEIFIYDLYPGKTVYTTELLTSPLTKAGNKKIREWRSIYLGVLNSIDLIVSKMFRGHQVDFDDCLMLLRREPVDFGRLERRLKETAQYDVSEKRALQNFTTLMRRMKELKS